MDSSLIGTSRSDIFEVQLLMASMLQCRCGPIKGSGSNISRKPRSDHQDFPNATAYKKLSRSSSNDMQLLNASN